MAVTISIIFRLPWQKFVEWLKFMSFNGRSHQMAEWYLKIHMTYVENIFDYIEILWKNI